MCASCWAAAPQVLSPASSRHLLPASCLCWRFSCSTSRPPRHYLCLFRRSRQPPWPIFSWVRGCSSVSLWRILSRFPSCPSMLSWAFSVLLSQCISFVSPIGLKGSASASAVRGYGWLWAVYSSACLSSFSRRCTAKATVLSPAYSTAIRRYFLLAQSIIRALPWHGWCWRCSLP